MKLPKVLVITQSAFNTEHGSGIALTTFFSGWPKDRIAQVHIDDPNVVVDDSVCTTRYPLTIDELRPVWPLRIYQDWRSRSLARGTTSNVAENAHSSASSLEPPVAAFAPSKRNFLGRVKDHLNAWLVRHGFYQPVIHRVTPGLAQFVDDFGPEVIFSTLGDLAFCKLVLAAKERTGARLVVQLGDDWVAYYRHKDLASRFMAGSVERALREVIEKGDRLYIACDIMREAYKRRYGGEFDILLTPVETDKWHVRKGTGGVVDPKRYTVVYAGAVLKHVQHRGLKEIAVAIDQLREQGLAGELVLAVPPAMVEELQDDFKSAPVRVVPTRGQADVIEQIAKADLLVIPATFDKVAKVFTRYSMPGKMVAYMATGVPVLVYGPPEMPPVREAMDYNVAFAVTRQSSEELRNNLVMALTDISARANVVDRALQRAKTAYEQELVIHRFQQAISEEGAAFRVPVSKQTEGEGH